MSKQNQIKRAIKNDIDIINNYLEDNNRSFRDLKSLHMKIDGKYQTKISNWGKSMYNWSDNYGFDYNNMGIDAVRENLYIMRSKLEGYLQDYDIIFFESFNNSTPTFVNYNNNQNSNTNKVEMILDFDMISNNIKNMESLTSEETNKILEIIKELKTIYNSKESRKDKWEKAKKIALWTLDKSVDVAIQILPILIEIAKK